MSQIGIASWYGPGFHGRPTASGAMFNQFDLTAAHRTLPLGSRVVVTNLENGKSIEVSVNDRGPFVKGRVIDLSYASAKALAMVRRGIVPVRIELIRNDQARIARIRSHLDYTIQVGSFVRLENAANLKIKLSEIYPWATPLSVVLFRDTDTTYYRVQLGIFQSKDAAEKRSLQLVHDGFSAIVMENWGQHADGEDTAFAYPF